MIILITGSRGYLGTVLSNQLKACGHVVLGVSRSSINDPDNFIYFNYSEKSACFPSLKINPDLIIHTGYNFFDKRLNDSNENIIAINNIIKFSKFYKIKLINISTLSAFDGCKSKYGQVKLKIEKIVQLNEECSFRLRIFDSLNQQGLLKKFKKLTEITKFFGVGFGFCRSKQYITNIDRFALFIDKLITAEMLLPSGTYSYCSQIGFDINFIIKNISKAKFLIKIPWQLFYIMLYLFERQSYLKLRFGSDSLIGLVFASEYIKDNLYE